MAEWLTKQGLADRIGKSPRTVQSRISQMEDSPIYSRGVARDGKIVLVEFDYFVRFLQSKKITRMERRQGTR